MNGLAKHHCWFTCCIAALCQTVLCAQELWTFSFFFQYTFLSGPPLAEVCTKGGLCSPAFDESRAAIDQPETSEQFRIRRHPVGCCLLSIIGSHWKTIIRNAWTGLACAPAEPLMAHASEHSLDEVYVYIYIIYIMFVCVFVFWHILFLWCMKR